MKIGLSILLLVQLAVAPAQSAGSLDGTVVRLDNRDPVEGVQVVLISTALSEDPARPTPSRSTVTNAQGKFILTNVAPGTYRLTFSANGYVRQEYGQRAFPGRGTQIPIAAGQTLKDLTATLMPTGTVAGTVHDDRVA